MRMVIRVLPVEIGTRMQVAPREGQVVLEHQGRIGEVDAVLAEVRGCLHPVPFDLHLATVCTIVQHAKPSGWLKPGGYGLRLSARGSAAPVCEYAITVRRD